MRDTRLRRPTTKYMITYIYWKCSNNCIVVHIGIILIVESATGFVVLSFNGSAFTGADERTQ